MRDARWPRTDIDRFILARLEQHGLRPALDADALTLGRRLHFDLSGLPPTPEELDAFARDAALDRPGAIQGLVDRLLASPRFGEHWARHWFDIVRFGESLTLRGFIYKEAWRYRDYVIDAFNEDRPYDQFLREQIAGDLLPHPSAPERRRQLVATTFLAMGDWNLEEQDKKLLRMDIVDEQLDTIGKAFLGQTIGCARCHDHKFDPIPTRDYYALAGILRSTRTVTNANVSGWLEVPLPLEPEQEHLVRQREQTIAALRREIAATKDASKSLATATGDASRAVHRPPGSGDSIPPRELPGIIVDSAQARAVGAWTRSQFNKPYIGDGYWHDGNTGKGAKTLTFAPELARAGRYEVRLAYSAGGSRATNAPVTIFHADGETTVTVNQQPAPTAGLFTSLGQFRFEANGFGHVLVANEETHGHVTADAVQFLPLDEAPAASSPRSGSGRAAGRTDSTNSTQLKSLEARLKELQDSGPKRPLALSVIDETILEDTFIHVRGSPHNVGARVPRGFLRVVPPTLPAAITTNQSGRRELAAWITDPANPLTARVFVNRAWLWLHGEGLVRTPDNFGSTGEAPSHPELLDHLAAGFVERGWSVKQLVREMVLARTYQLASSALPLEGMDVDAKKRSNVAGDKTPVPSAPASSLARFDDATKQPSPDSSNRLLSHAHRRRLTAEQLRDAILAVSGELRLDPGGFAYPVTLASDFEFTFKEPRRSVYAPVFRNSLPEIFEAFDFPAPTMVVGRRNTSTVASQALFLLNHPWVREQAQSAARRMLGSAPQVEATRIERAYLHALGRRPTERERELGRRQLARETATPSLREEAWTELFTALFASGDFRHLD